MNPKLFASLTTTLLPAAAVLLFGNVVSTTRGQTVPLPPPASTDPATQLEQFVVQGTQDRGYSTTNAIGVTRTNTPLIDIPQVVNVVTREFLEDANAGELYDALKYISGIAIESNVGDSVMIRGYTVRGQHTDGLGDNQNQSQAGAEPFLFERLEILKGPSALVYGSHAIGGVLNRVRKTPQWKPAGLAALTIGNHAQYKGEFDYTAPLNDKVAYRLLAVYRDEDLVNGVETRHAFFKRWNLEPMVTIRPTQTMQVRIVGEFLHEEGFKHWGDNAQLQPFVFNGASTFGLLPRDFTFSDEQSKSGNDKHALWASVETEVNKHWSLRLATYLNKWYHDTVDILPSGIQANNRLMGRTWRFISNNDYDYTGALDSIANFDLVGAHHKFLAIGQATQSTDDTRQFNGANPPPLDIYAPVYGYVGPVNPTLATSTHNIGQSRSASFQDHAQWLDGKFQLVGGARYDWYTTRTDNWLTRVGGVQNRGHNWTYKYGGIFKPMKAMSVFYNYAETFQPNFGSNPDGSTFVPQTGVIKEVGVKTALLDGRLSATVSAYDLVLENILTLDPDPARASAGYRVQTARQTTRGLEADVFLNLIGGWELMLGGATMDITLPTGLLPRNAPEKTASAWTRYKFSTGPLKGVSFGGGWNWHGRAPAEAGNLIFFPAFSTVDAFAQYSWGNYRFSLNLSNAFDKWYLARGINRNIFYAGPERLIKVRVSRAF
jgi:iron complex outermembrane receptor protein